MAINIKVGASGPPSEDLFSSEAEEPKKPQASMKMNARKTLNGDMAIYDHMDIDIVGMPGSNKVLALAKADMSDDVYETQSRLFDFLVKKGIVLPETVRGGNVYGSLEGKYPASKNGKDHGQVAIFTIGKFLEEEKPYYMWNQKQEEVMEDWWLEAPEEDTTEYGEVPQDDYKGSIPKPHSSNHGYRIYESSDS